MKQRFISMEDLEKVIAEKIDFEKELMELGASTHLEYRLIKDALNSLKSRALIRSSIIENLETA